MKYANKYRDKIYLCMKVIRNYINLCVYIQSYISNFIWLYVTVFPLTKINFNSTSFISIFSLSTYRPYHGSTWRAIIPDKRDTLSRACPWVVLRAAIQRRENHSSVHNVTARIRDFLDPSCMCTKSLPNVLRNTIRPTTWQMKRYSRFEWYFIKRNLVSRKFPLEANRSAMQNYTRNWPRSIQKVTLSQLSVLNLLSTCKTRKCEVGEYFWFWLNLRSVVLPVIL